MSDEPKKQDLPETDAAPAPEKPLPPEPAAEEKVPAPPPAPESADAPEPAAADDAKGGDGEELDGDIIASPEKKSRVSAVVGRVDRPLVDPQQQRRGRGGRGPGGPGGRGRGPGGPGGRGRGPGRGPGGRGRGPGQQEEEDSGLIEKVVHINRCAKVVAGGRRFSFAALVVVGDGDGQVGVGYGKAKEVPECIRKGTEQARKNMATVKRKNNTIPHEAVGEHDGGKVLLRPATPGTGVIAGGGVRAVLEAAGIKDVLTKSLRSNNPAAMVFATLDALRQMRSMEDIRNLRAAE
ncbi:MAG: 30S ribosomal protein S5 [Opitutales bacterium]|nr:30S ribosomal protein S5 [Opitutales bacterium]